MDVLDVMEHLAESRDQLPICGEKHQCAECKKAFDTPKQLK
jgi:hypothetical protein